jgi:glucosamine-6-phosphate deaminase
MPHRVTTSETHEPRLVVTASREAVAEEASRLILERVRAKPDLVLGLATGRTQTAIYGRLVAAIREARASFARVTTFNLDEYAGLGADDPDSFHATMMREFFSQSDVDPARIHLLDGAAPDAAEEAARFEAAIRAAGGIDLQVLGIGENGHIGFNEPGADPRLRTRLVRLHEETRAANRDLFPPGRDVPHEAITMGVATILEAREILLVAVGPAKAKAVRAALEGPVTAHCPASVLRRHSAVTFVVDEAAAARLSPPARGERRRSG